MASLAASLLAVTLLIHVPVENRAAKIGWAPPPPEERIEFSVDRSVQATRAGGGAPTSIGVPTPHPISLPSDEIGSPNEGDQPSHSVVRPMQIRETVYDLVQNPPAIRGGLGAYYIHIEYPPEAVAREIEGRLVLRFVVGADGKARDIFVRESLHPLCDSAAVKALRQTTFVPGRQNGKKVSVRMHLPVRFRLVGPGRTASESS